jgi:hypothetical protein
MGFAGIAFKRKRKKERERGDKWLFGWEGLIIVVDRQRFCWLFLTR